MAEPKKRRKKLKRRNRVPDDLRMADKFIVLTTKQLGKEIRATAAVEKVDPAVWIRDHIGVILAQRGLTALGIPAGDAAEIMTLAAKAVALAANLEEQLDAAKERIRRLLAALERADIAQRKAENELGELELDLTPVADHKN